MSKADHNAKYYYSYTSPAPNAPTADLGGSSSSPLAPPSYDEAVATVPTPTAPKFDSDQEQQQQQQQHLGLDATFPAYNPSVVPDNDDEPHAPLLASDDDDNAFRGRSSPPNYSVYQPPYETTNDGDIVTRDVHLNADGEAIVQFLVQHNTRPQMHVRFYGYHEETHWRTRSTRDENGNLVEEREPVNTRVDDFCFSIEASEFVAPECDGLYVIPDKKTGKVKSVRQLCDEFVHEKNKLKELRLTKVVDWNYPELTRAFTAAIRAQGYYHAIEIAYQLKEEKITIKSSSNLSRYLDHRGIRLLLFICCLWIIVWPVWWCYRKLFGHNSLQSKWHMNITERDWYNLKVQEVLGQVRHQGQAFGAVPFILG